MQLLAGKFLSKIEKIFPVWVMNQRVRIADRIISVHAVDTFHQYQIMNQFNKFLGTMKQSDRKYVMAMCGLKDAPSWTNRIHTGE